MQDQTSKEISKASWVLLANYVDYVQREFDNRHIPLGFVAWCRSF